MRAFVALTTHTCAWIKQSKACVRKCMCAPQLLLLLCRSPSRCSAIPPPPFIAHSIWVFYFISLLFSFFCTCFTLRAVFIAAVFVAAAFYSLDPFLPSHHTPPQRIHLFIVLSLHRSPIIFHACTHTHTHARTLSRFCCCTLWEPKCAVATLQLDELSYFQRKPK